jgi:hypothetical protein
MERRELISIALVALIASLCLVCGAEAEEDLLDEGFAIPICRYINASETHQLNFSVVPNVAAASFFVDFGNESSDLEMVLITPSGAGIDSTTGEPIIYERNGRSIYYIVPDPEPGEWIAEITAKNVPEASEEYCAFMVLDEEYGAMLNSTANFSDEVLYPDECENCTSE